MVPPRRSPGAPRPRRVQYHEPAQLVARDTVAPRGHPPRSADAERRRGVAETEQIRRDVGRDGRERLTVAARLRQDPPQSRTQQPRQPARKAAALHHLHHARPQAHHPRHRQAQLHRRPRPLQRRRAHLRHPPRQRAEDHRGRGHHRPDPRHRHFFCLPFSGLMIYMHSKQMFICKRTVIIVDM